MKFVLLLLTMLTFSAIAAECQLTGVLESSQRIETSFVASTPGQCKSMARQTKTNHFYGLIEKQDRLVETIMRFKDKVMTKEIITFDSESAI